MDFPAIDAGRLAASFAANSPRQPPSPLPPPSRLGNDIDALEHWRLPDGMSSATRQLLGRRAQQQLHKETAKIGMMNTLQESYRRNTGARGSQLCWKCYFERKFFIITIYFRFEDSSAY